MAGLQFPGLPSQEVIMARYECDVCGLIYDEAKGLPDEGIPAGTRWEDIADDWVCPDCGAPKSAFIATE
ncbi:rubredoxin [Motiliproteus sediminis]|uniref:rubredoxin n=1 Tax=Motiliproteus sediminis TaxID=1468178 RepID=UPI003CCE80EB